MSFLSERHRQPEVMDQPGLDIGEHHHALTALARINWFSRSAGILWPQIRDLFRSQKRPLRLLDVASGAGDIGIQLWKKTNRAGFDLTVHGYDISDTAVSFARDNARRQNAPVEFFERDILQDDAPTGYDIVISSLFLHHLDEAQATELLRRMGQIAGSLVLINDLRRSWTGYCFAYLGTRLLSRSKVTHVDGPLSVEGAFTMVEALDLAQRAGLQGATVAKRWPCRFLLTWRRQ